MISELLYELRDISYLYLDKFSALNDINIDIREGERIALLGANGSGKSTLLLMLAGLILPNSGSVKFLGKDLAEGKAFRSKVGIVFQNPDIQLFNSNVTDEILFGLLQLDLCGKEINNRLENSLLTMGIGHLRDRHPQYLSIGEKKRVAIASVFAMEPDVFLLDEPTAGLDPRTTRHLIETISMLNKNGKTIITATQDIHIVPEIADRVVVLSEEKSVVKDGDVHNVLQDKELLEKHNLIHSHIHTHEGKPHVHPHEHPDHHHPHD
jgi:cobalt/nickel transport system ATP-binding protein